MKKLYTFFCIAVVFIVFNSCTEPEASFTNTWMTAAHPPAEIYFTSTSIDADSWEWDFGDGTTSDEESVKHTFYESGEFKVSLTAKNGLREDTYTEVITIQSKKYQFVMHNTTSKVLDDIYYYCAADDAIWEKYNLGQLKPGDQSNILESNFPYLQVFYSISGVEYHTPTWLNREDVINHWNL